MQPKFMTIPRRCTR